MRVNIAGRGHILEPVIDFDADDALDQVETAMLMERRAHNPAAQMPTEDEVAKQHKQWKREARIERAAAEIYIKRLTPGPKDTFRKLRMKERRDREILGWGAWEIIRQDGVPVRANHVPSRSLRLTPVDATPTEVETWLPISAVTRVRVPVMQKFRRIVQLDGTGRSVYFKEYGEQRVISAATGIAYESVEDMRSEKGEGKNAREATEILWWGDDGPEGPYPQPRYHGLIPNIIGSREASEDNANYFRNSAIPQGLLLVSDGRVGKSSHGSLNDFFSSSKGKARGKIAVIEATTPRETAILAGSGRVQIQWQSLREAQQDDITFSGYIKLTSTQVQESFRLPSIALGRGEDITRATALAGMEVVEDQVYAPDRDDDDELINLTLMVDWGIRFWRIRSRGLQKRDPEAVAKQAQIYLKEGVVRPDELRELAELNLGVPLSSAPAWWQRITQNMLLTGWAPDGTHVSSGPMDGQAQPPAPAPAGAEGPPQPAALRADDVNLLAAKILRLEKRAREIKQRDLLLDLASADEEEHA
jgi:capsid portal protein